MSYSVDNLIAYDLEVYPNYFLAGFILPDGSVYQYHFTDYNIDDLQPLRQFLAWADRAGHGFVGFNSASYDDAVLSEFLIAPSVTTAYHTSLQLIEERVPAWKFENEIHSVDLIKILPNQMSLKKIGVCLGHKKLQELPINPHKNLRHDEMKIIAAYNINDIEITQKLYQYDKFHKELVMRSDLSNEYGIDLRSKGEAQVAEQILCSVMEHYTGINGRQLKKTARENVLQNPNFTVHRPTWFDGLDAVRYPTLNKVIETGNKIFNRQIHIIDYKIAKGSLNDTIYIGDRWYQMGIGGLHSVDGPGAWIPAANEKMKDIDVRSYYPEMMLTQKLSPRHWIVEGIDYFQAAYAPIVTKRVEAKINGDKILAERLKIVVNGTFGKTNDPFSALYDPYVMASVTVTGQLGLLALIAMLTDIGATVVSANTDGVTVKYDEELEDAVNAAVAIMQKGE